MGEIVDGLAAPERGRIARLRDRGAFFWLDASSAETSEADLADALGTLIFGLLLGVKSEEGLTYLTAGSQQKSGDQVR